MLINYLHCKIEYNSQCLCMYNLNESLNPLDVLGTLESDNSPPPPNMSIFCSGVKI